MFAPNLAMCFVSGDMSVFRQQVQYGILGTSKTLSHDFGWDLENLNMFRTTQPLL